MTTNDKVPAWVWVVGLGAAAALIYFGGRFFRDVFASISAWKPKDDAEDEAAHRDSLASYMRESLPKYSLMKEYSRERARADIVIGDSERSIESSSQKFAVELKYRLKDKTEIDRLVGQCVGYRTLGFEKAFVVLVNPDPTAIEVLKSRAAVDTLSGFLTLVAHTPETPNKAPEPTPGSVTSCAPAFPNRSPNEMAQLAPAPGVAHL